MSQMIFVNLPVTDLPRAIAFHEALGARREPNFSNDEAAMMVLSDTIHIMLLTHRRFSDFTQRRIIDAHQDVQTLICLSVPSREQVDALIARAVEAGGEADPGPVQEYGFMYGRSFADPDGHIFELMWMDAQAAQGAADYNTANSQPGAQA